jgi:hypothetical protein
MGFGPSLLPETPIRIWGAVAGSWGSLERPDNRGFDTGSVASTGPSIVCFDSPGSVPAEPINGVVELALVLSPSARPIKLEKRGGAGAGTSFGEPTGCGDTVKPVMFWLVTAIVSSEGSCTRSDSDSGNAGVSNAGVSNVGASNVGKVSDGADGASKV